MNELVNIVIAFADLAEAEGRTLRHAIVRGALVIAMCLAAGLMALAGVAAIAWAGLSGLSVVMPIAAALAIEGLLFMTLFWSNPMDRPKTAPIDPTDQLVVSKSRLRLAVAAFSPLDPVRQHPLASVGLALTTGLALSNMPRTREALLRAIDGGLSLLLKLAMSPLSLAFSKTKVPEVRKDTEKQGVQ
ncbi:MAG: hypothetical protein ABSH20_25130 [Tepidisphaeraceae bacterium]|jgi:hypothetical protein